MSFLLCALLSGCWVGFLWNANNEGLGDLSMSWRREATKSLGHWLIRTFIIRRQASVASSSVISSFSIIHIVSSWFLGIKRPEHNDILVNRAVVTVMRIMVVKEVGGERWEWRKENPIHFKMWSFLASIFLSFVHHIKAWRHTQRSYLTS